ncbi:MAG: sigma-70 family RNA polymerase sigma factor [Planctomycetota bacterium]
MAAESNRCSPEPSSREPSAPRTADSLADVVRQAQAHDPQALARLAERLNPLVRVLARAKMGATLRAQMDPDDLAQSCMFEVLRDVDKVEYRGAGEFHRWVACVLRNKVRDKAEYFRRVKRDVKRQVSIPDGGETTSSVSATPMGQLPDDTRGPATRVGDAELFSKVWRAVRELPDELRVVVSEKLRGLSFHQIAQRLNLSDSMVERRFVRGLEVLRRVLNVRVA